MRAPRLALVAIPLVAVLLFSAAPAAVAEHEDPIAHFATRTQKLAPGEEHVIHATFDRGPLRGGWVFIMSGLAIANGSATLEGTLSLNGTTVHEFTWNADGQVNLESLALPETADVYDVTLNNTGANELTYVFYFDQSCDCLGKPVLHLKAPWWYVFNFPFYAGQTPHFSLTPPEDVPVQYTVATRDGEGGHWPDDFTPIAKYPDDADEEGRVSWDVGDQDRTFYVFAQAVGNPQVAGQMLSPQFFVTEANANDGEKATPAPGALVLVGLIAASALVAGRARSSRRAR